MRSGYGFRQIGKFVRVSEQVADWRCPDNGFVFTVHDLGGQIPSRLTRRVCGVSLLTGLEIPKQVEQWQIHGPKKLACFC